MSLHACVWDLGGLWKTYCVLQGICQIIQIHADLHIIFKYDIVFCRLLNEWKSDYESAEFLGTDESDHSNIFFDYFCTL